MRKFLILLPIGQRAAKLGGVSVSELPTIGDLGALTSVSAAPFACHPHASYVLLSMHSVIEKPSGAS
jgi:hypothetical protein